jgi:FixJ family two-component response regulator
VKERKPSIPVIMMTGFGTDVMTDGRMPDGIDRILSKPVSTEDLRRAIFEITNPLPAAAPDAPGRLRGPLSLPC